MLELSRCERRGRLSIAKLIERFGAAVRLTDLRSGRLPTRWRCIDPRPLRCPLAGAAGRLPAAVPVSGWRLSAPKQAAPTTLRAKSIVTDRTSRSSISEPAMLKKCAAARVRWETFRTAASHWGCLLAGGDRRVRRLPIQFVALQSRVGARRQPARKYKNTRPVGLR